MPGSRPRTVRALVAGGALGWGLALVGIYLGPGHWLTGMGLLVAGVATVWLAVIAQQGPSRG